ncbi:CBS domain-containing protein [Streptomyces sp. NPDC051000]|uniref:CBS domain-containing protein n=1 Tax=Streptomyces sp. NPDC051000 TaxID=3155520 RepID=UPI0033E85AD6
MTLVQMRPHQPRTNPAQSTTADIADADALQVGDDMTVEVALSVMAGARASHLLVRDQDGQCAGTVTRSGLTAFRDSSAYTDLVRLRDIPGDRGPLDAPVATAPEPVSEPAYAPRSGRPDALPAAGEQGAAAGGFALAR